MGRFITGTVFFFTSAVFSLCPKSFATIIPFSSSEKAATLGIGAAALTLSWAFSGPEENARWDNTLLFDDSIAHALGSETRANSMRFQNWSDWTRASAVALPIIFVGPMGDTGRWQVAQSYAVTGLIATVLKSTAGRARPYTTQCRDNPLGQDCFSKYRNESFPSGHSAFAFAGAGLLCALRSDAFCPVGLSIAAATATLRMLGNQHYLSDVLVGAAIGWISGYHLSVWQGRDHKALTAAKNAARLAPMSLVSYQFRF